MDVILIILELYKMNPINHNSSIKNLLQYCTSNRSPLYQDAWKEFFKRYKEKIYQIILYRCKSWHSAKLNNQLKDIVNDIVSEVFIVLPTALTNFKNINDERSFLAFLGTICNRTVSRYLKKHCYEFVLDDEAMKKTELNTELSLDNRWELFDFISVSLMSKSSQKRNASRDLCLFLLFTWANFSIKEINRLSCFQNINYKIVDNVVSRGRKSLKEKYN